MDSAVWDSNGRVLAISDGERVHVYDAAEEKEITSVPIGAARLDWSPDGSRLAVSTMQATDNPFVAEGEVRIWSRDSGGWTRTLSVGKVSSDPEDSSLAFDSNGDTLAVTTTSGVQLWDASRGRLLRKLRPSGADGSYFAAYAAAFSPDGELVASGGWERVNVWRARDGKLLWSKDISGRQVLALAFSPDGDLLISGGIGGGVEVWQARDGTLLQTHERPQGSTVEVSSVAFDPERERVVSFDRADSTVRVWPR
jgi:WD40 repeat protein